VAVANLSSAENRLLAALPNEEQRRVLQACEPVEIGFSNTLCEPGEPIQHVYFPTSSFISLVTPVHGHAGLEVALVGNEGMVGIPLLLGVECSSLQFLVQGPGSAWRMDAASFRRELQRSPALTLRLNRYLHVLTCQLAQTAACIRYHVVEARLARWLLMTQDRAHSNGFHVTHEFLAYMLGVRRVGITKAAGSLQHKKLIRYKRGDITIVDRKGLEAASCGCYQADKQIYERMLG
jgi:CRP-like cAMP-binding protein